MIRRRKTKRRIRKSFYQPSQMYFAYLLDLHFLLLFLQK
jgi:hypothetical protein